MGSQVKNMINTLEKFEERVVNTPIVRVEMPTNDCLDLILSDGTCVRLLQEGEYFWNRIIEPLSHFDKPIHKVLEKLGKDHEYLKVFVEGTNCTCADGYLYTDAWAGYYVYSPQREDGNYSPRFGFTFEDVSRVYFNPGDDDNEGPVWWIYLKTNPDDEKYRGIQR